VRAQDTAAIVTGGASGLGEGVVRMLLETTMLNGEVVRLDAATRLG
jgi:NAD(P)-dependent dehydrogenase (short-subunit alcohol dehydrogenase family)